MLVTRDIFLPSSMPWDNLTTTLQIELRKNKLQIIHIPTIKITYNKKEAVFCQHKLEKLKKTDIILFTSQYAVHFFFQRIKKLALTNFLAQKKWLVIGEKTAEKLTKDFPSAKNILLPKEASTKGLLDFITQEKLQNSYYWFACSCLTGYTIQKFITSCGGECFQEVIYNNYFPTKSRPLLQNYFSKKTPLWAIFTSPSSFQNITNTLKEKSSIFQKIKIATLGNTTAKFIEKKKISVLLVKTTSEQILETIIQKETE